MATFTENNKVVNAFVPVDVNSAAKIGDWVNMENYDKLVIILTGGVVGAAATVTVKKGTSAAGAGSTAMAFNYKSDTDVTSSDALGATFTAATSSGFSTGTDNNQQRVIEIDAAELPSTATSFDWVSVRLTDPGSSSFWCGTYILSGGRVSRDVPPTAIA